jgi:hypothetical protein
MVAVSAAWHALSAIALEWEATSGLERIEHNLEELSDDPDSPSSERLYSLILLRNKIVHFGSEKTGEYDLHKPHAPQPHPSDPDGPHTDILAASYTVQEAKDAVDIMIDAVAAVVDRPKPIAKQWANDHRHVLIDLRKRRSANR